MYSDITVNYLSVVVAAVVAFIIGWAWYGALFKKQWMALADMPAQPTPEMKKMMMPSMVIGFVATLISAYVLAHFSGVWNVSDASGALQLGFWVWLGFMMPLNIGPALWEMKSWKFAVLNGAHSLVATLAMALIVGLWK